MGTFEKHRAPGASTPVWKTARRAWRPTRDESPIFSGVTISPELAPRERLCGNSPSIFDGLKRSKARAAHVKLPWGPRTCGSVLRISNRIFLPVSLTGSVRSRESQTYGNSLDPCQYEAPKGRLNEDCSLYFGAG
jgi:hypothetical protein